MSLNIKTDGGKLRVADKSKKAYIPIASSSSLGVVKVGDGLEVETDGTLNVVGGGGSLSHQKANWIATSTSAVQVKVTDTLTLNKGQYIIIVQIPTSNSSSGGVTIWINDENLQLLTVPSSYNNSIFFLEVLEDNSTLDLKSQDSSVHSYSNLQRGFLQAIKLG